MSAESEILPHSNSKVTLVDRLGRLAERFPFGYAVAAIIIAGTIIRVPSFFIPIWAERPNFHPFRQTQTLTMVREIIRQGPDFSSPFPIFGPPWSVPFEFPIYQNIAGLVGIVSGLDDVMASRIVTIAFFQASGLVLALLARRLVGPLAALVALSIWELSQLTWTWSVAPTIEFTAVFFVLSALLLTVRTTRGKWTPVGFVGLTVLWAMAFLTKLPTALVWMPFLIAVLVVTAGQPRRSMGSWAHALVPVALGGITGLIFASYGERVKESSPFTLFLTQENLTGWYYGTAEQRLDPSNWSRLLMHGNGIAGIFVVVVIVSAILAVRANRHERVVVAGSVVSIVGAVMIFFNLYFVHDYYFLAIAPLIALLVGIIGANTYRFVSNRASALAGLSALVFLVLVTGALSWILSQGKPALSKFVAQEWRYGQSDEIAASTQPEDGVVVVGCSWSPEVLYFADRRGLMLQNDWSPGNSQYRIPGEWVGESVDFVFLCSDGVDIPSLFETPVNVSQVSSRLYRVQPQS